jgi:hypothetical protein
MAGGNEAGSAGMEWLTKNWDRGHYLSAAVGIAAGVVLVLLHLNTLALIAAPLISLSARWSMWQIPPPGRSRAPGTPPDAAARLVQLVIAVLIVTLLVLVVDGPFQ